MDLFENLEELWGKPLLLGNGFSVLNNPTFNYTNLIDEIKNEYEDEMTTILNDNNNKNIEEILFKIQSSIEICKILTIDVEKIKKVEEKLKKSFIETITKIQPDSNFFRTESGILFGNQLKKFGNIFTTSYDLNLYYLMVQSKNGLKNHSDNFSNDGNYLKFDNENNEIHRHHIYYLHGNIMLFSNKDNVYKVRHSQGQRIVSQIEENLNNNYLPLIITEGNSEHKLNKINGNKYLRFCFKEFIKLKSLVIFGHSLSEFDKHILDVINDSKKRVYYGLNKPTNEKINKVKSLFGENIELKIFDSSLLFNTDQNS
jgi:hypothetical protein